MIDKDLGACQVHGSKRLYDAMVSLDRGGVEVALVVDESRRLLGTMTDGDVRRALLAGAGLDAPLAPHYCRTFTAVGPETGRAEVLDLMQARTISQIPIVDGSGKLLGLHLLHEILGAVDRSNWAVVMAGGQGTRLLPLTEHVPKPMIRVAGRPILERIVLHLVSFGIRRVFISVNHLGHIIERHFGDGAQFGCQISYLREDRPLGTGGPLSLLPEAPPEPILVMNGDLVTQADLGSMLDAHVRRGPRVTIAARRYFHTVPFGCLGVDGVRVVQIDEKPTLSQFVNAGIYMIDPSLLERIPRDQNYLITTLFEDCLRRGELVEAFEIEDEWVDIGQREQLRLAREGRP